MRRVTATVLLVLILACVGVADAQVCGDLNNSGGIPNLSDLVYFFQFLCDQEGYAPFLSNWMVADVDHREGLTVADAVMMGNRIFIADPGVLTCNITGTYSMAASPADTIFVPRMLSIPDGIDSVLLPIRSHLDAQVQGVYLPMVKAGPQDNGMFRLTSLRPVTEIGFIYGDFQCTPCDTFTFMAIGIPTAGSPFDTAILGGSKTIAYLKYTRISPGDGSVAPVAVDRDALWRPSIERNTDLLLPVVQYYDFAFPPETLQVSLGTIAFDAVAGYPSSDSFVVSFTSNSLPISFTLTATEPWITFVDTGAVGFRTPCNVVVKADATSTGIGNYAGQIQFTNLNPSAPTTITAIDVSMNVRAPNLYPFGDLDCDGIVDISDLTRIIDHLFITISPLTPCQP